MPTSDAKVHMEDALTPEKPEKPGKQDKPEKTKEGTVTKKPIKVIPTKPDTSQKTKKAVPTKVSNKTKQAVPKTGDPGTVVYWVLGMIITLIFTVSFLRKGNK